MPNIEFKYSDQARVLIGNLKGFEKKKFEKWFLESPYIVIGDGHIIDYLVNLNKNGLR